MWVPCPALKGSIFLSLIFLYVAIFGMYLINSCSEFIFDVDVCCFNFFMVSFPFCFDWMSVVFCLAVILISSVVMLYSSIYMSHEVFLARFIWLVMLFVFSMNLLIFMPNMLSLMVGWDGLGIISFLLVIYYQDKSSLGAGMITALSNRIGDMLFIVSIGLLGFQGSWNLLDCSEMKVFFLLVGLIIVGSMTKSAQIPFSAWLPAAMAAPTPVSALVHSSTLVTAGVYVLIRFSDSISMGWCIFLMMGSSMTLLMAGLSASFEIDLKKIIALSTLSQLGVMILILSIGAKSVCMFHLVTHALFKALMFLCAGSVIYFSGGVQDSRFFSGLWYKMPMISGWLIVSCFSLMGIPFMAGFYSKDLILELCLFNGFSLLGVIMIMFPTFLTAFYGFRFLMMMFFNQDFSCLSSFSNSSVKLNVPTSVLGVGAVFSGFLLEGLVKGFSEFVFVSSNMKLLTPSMVLSGLVVSIVWLFYFKSSFILKFYSKSPFKFLITFLSKMWFLPFLSSFPIVSSSLKNFSKVFMQFDFGWVEYYVGGQGMKLTFFNWFKVSQEVQSGRNVGMWIISGIWVFVSCSGFLILFYYLFNL